MSLNAEPSQAASAAAAAILVLGFALTSSRAASADPTAAEERYRAAETAYAHGWYRVAAETFEGAYREDHHGASIFNAGVSWQLAGEAARAADAFSLALTTSDLPAEERADAKKRVTDLESNVGRIDATGPADAKVAIGDAAGAALPAHVHVPPGSWTLRTSYADGHVESRDVTVVAGQSLTLDLTPSRTAVPPGPQSTAQPSSASADGTKGRSSLRTVGWLAVGGAAVLAGAAVYLGVSTLDARSAFDASGHTSQEDHDRAVNLRTWTNVAAVGAGLVGVTGVVLLLWPVGTSTPTTAVSRASIILLPGGLSLRAPF